MMITSINCDSIDYDELATLKRIALNGGLEREVDVPCSKLSDEFGVSTQTVFRRLRELEATNHIDRLNVDEGQTVQISPKGESVLHREYCQYRQLFDQDDYRTLEGPVTDGMGEGKHYISLDGYQRQFEDRLGYVPFPGTLNVEVDESNGRFRNRLREALDGVRIDEWSSEEQTYGAATCYPVTVRAVDRSYAHAHLLVPERTNHDDCIVEVIAPVKLRTELSISTGSNVSLHVME